jgi:hypothetical protein
MDSGRVRGLSDPAGGKARQPRSWLVMAASTLLPTVHNGLEVPEQKEF